MKFYVSTDPSHGFDNAEEALRVATNQLYLKPNLFDTYVDRLNRGLVVTWGYGFGELSVRPVRIERDAPAPKVVTASPGDPP